MRAVMCEGSGDESVLRIAEVPVPPLRPGAVRIRVHAAGLNRADLLQRRGLYPPPPGVTPVLGLECAGTVAEVAPGVTRWAPGDRVMAVLPGGGQAEEVVADAGLLLPVPENLGLTEAAALPEALATIDLSVFRIGRLRRGETVLIHGGSGGIGTIGIQMARAVGARVVATAGGARRCARCEALGAHRCADHVNGRFEDAVAEVSGGRGADVILDIVGGPYLERHLAAAAPGGRIVVIALAGGRRAEIDLAPLLRRRLTLAGSTLRARPLEERRRIVREVARRFLPRVARGEIRPVLSHVLPVTEVARAHELMARSRHFGKIVLTFTAGEERDHG